MSALPRKSPHWALHYSFMITSLMIHHLPSSHTFKKFLQKKRWPFIVHSRSYSISSGIWMLLAQSVPTLMSHVACQLGQEVIVTALSKVASILAILRDSWCLSETWVKTNPIALQVMTHLSKVNLLESLAKVLEGWWKGRSTIHSGRIELIDVSISEDRYFVYQEMLCIDWNESPSLPPWRLKYISILQVHTNYYFISTRWALHSSLFYKYILLYFDSLSFAFLPMIHDVDNSSFMPI
jgi:hypothetical protein